MNPLKRILTAWRERRAQKEEWALREVKARYHAFRIFLENNGRALELIVDMDRALSKGEDDDLHGIMEELLVVSGELVDGLNLLSGDAYPGLYALHGRMGGDLRARLAELGALPAHLSPCVPLDAVEPSAHRQVGTKAGNLAALRRMGLPVPDGFACTVRACRRFLEEKGLADEIRRTLREAELGRMGIGEAAGEVRRMILAMPLPADLGRALRASLARLAGDGSVSVRSSGVAEDSAAHSFAGQYSSLLNVSGDEAV